MPVRVCPKQDILNMFNMMKNQAGNMVAPSLVKAFEVNRLTDRREQKTIFKKKKINIKVEVGFKYRKVQVKNLAGN